MLWYNKIMNKNYYILAVVLALVAGGAWWWQNKNGAPFLDGNQPVTGEPSANTTGSEAVVGGKIISFNGAGFEPNMVKIRVGETVTFRNDSATQVWPASAMHPTHKAYPTTGGCIGSTFDTCRGLMPGDSWSFKFDLEGDWKYHDHLNPKIFGTIVVAE